MPIWRIRPVADPQDPRWLDNPVWREVLVRASSSAFARRLAAQMERDADEPATGNESLSHKSAFEDEKLYQVVRLSPEEEKAATGGARAEGVLRARKLRDRQAT